MDTTNPAVIIGQGEMGGSFARGLLRLGYTVVPVLRSTNPTSVAAQYPDPVITLVTVGEADLDTALATLPEPWRHNTGLVQNELLPRSWQPYAILNPTVAVVWFEKKPGRSETPIIATPVHGPQAELLVKALTKIAVPAVVEDDPDEMMYEMVRKNLFVITTNIAGLVAGDTVHDLWYNHRHLAEEVANDVLDVQESLVTDQLDRTRLIAGMVEADDADPSHGTTGRSAPDRLARAIGYADAAGLEVARLRQIAADLK